jgi:hypothetical protein
MAKWRHAWSSNLRGIEAKRKLMILMHLLSTEPPTADAPAVCTENLIHVDEVTESPKLVE